MINTLEANIPNDSLYFFKHDVILLFIDLIAILQLENEEILKVMRVIFKESDELIVILHMLIKII
jgi:hypothetical protein